MQAEKRRAASAAGTLIYTSVNRQRIEVTSEAVRSNDLGHSYTLSAFLASVTY